MDAQYRNGVVKAHCPTCGALATFEFPFGANATANTYMAIYQKGPFALGGAQYARARYRMLRCANCGRGALAVILDQGGRVEGEGTLRGRSHRPGRPAPRPWRR